MGHLCSRFTGVAQLVEHWSPNQVSGVRVSPSVLKNKLAGIRTYIEETINELTNKVSCLRGKIFKLAQLLS